jgi:hypothetical protein
LDAAAMFLMSLMGLVHLQSMIKELLVVAELLIVQKSVSIHRKWLHLWRCRASWERTGRLRL